MSLYGSLFSGVSGLNAQGTNISIIADNISNINTIGYKAGEVSFSTLVTSAATSTNYSSGGVNAANRQLVGQQGLIQGTGKLLDVAISGNGFLVVNTIADGKGSYLYTRAGSFDNDAKGNFVNSAGYTLMGWPLDNLGRLPGQSGNLNTASNALLQSLQPVNVKSVTGSASATTNIELGLNLKETQTTLAGSGETILFPTTSPANTGISSTSVIAPENTGANILNVGDSITLTPSSPGTPFTFTYGGLVQSNDITGTILGANTATSTFTGAGVTNGNSFTLQNAASGTVTFTFQATNPNVQAGQFNSLSSLAQAIDITPGLTARIDVLSKHLLVAPRDATKAMTFTDVTGTFAAALGLTTTVASPGRFATLDGLKTLINQSAGLQSSVENPLQSAGLKFYASDPLGTITVSANGSTVGGVTSTPTSVLAEFGLNTTNGSSFGPAYDSTAVTAPNMAGGSITPHFTRNVQVFDAFGSGHNFQVSFLKVATNTWAVEIFAATPSDIVSSRTDGQIAAGNVVFNGDGSLRTVSAVLTAPIKITWSNEASPSSISINWGTAGQAEGTVGATSVGKTDGLRQLAADYTVDFADQNGIASGLLSSVTIDKNGYVIANFTNGTSRNIFQLPLASFSNQAGLQNSGGNAYGETNLSGNFNLVQPNSGQVGSIVPASLEQANVELSNELTNMIVAQRGYQASSQVIKTVNGMLEDLNRALS